MLIVSCPECKKELKLRDDLAGKKIKCPSCGSAFLVSPPPTAAETTEAPAAAPPPPPAVDNITSRPPETLPGPATAAPEESPKRTKSRRNKEPKKGSKTPLFIGLGAAAALLFCCCPVSVMATWYLSRDSKPSAGRTSPGGPVAHNAGSDGSRDSDRGRRQPMDVGLAGPNVPVNPFAPKDQGTTTEPPKAGVGLPPIDINPFAPKDPGKTNPMPKNGVPGPPPSRNPFAPKPPEVDTGKFRDQIVGKWLDLTHVWTFTRDGHVEVDLGFTYKGTYKFAEADIIECKAEPKSGAEFDGRWKVAVTDATLKIDQPETFDMGRPHECQRLTGDDPARLAAAKANLTGKWTLADGKSTQPKALTFAADGGVEIDMLPQAFKGTFAFADETIIYIHNPGPAVGATKRGLWRVVVDGSTLKFGPATAKPEQLTLYKKAG